MAVVMFNSNGGDNVEPQYVEIGQKLIKPNNPKHLKVNECFVGWFYYLGEIEVFWNFETDVVNQDMVLYAKWSDLLCLDYTLLLQTLDNVKPVEFYTEIQGNVVWFVNGNRQYGVSGNLFTFYPPLVRGSYVINCEINGVASKEYVVAINYYTPKKLSVHIKKIEENLYTFNIEKGEYMNKDNCFWYCTSTDYRVGAELIGTGATCTKELQKDCKVFAVYKNSKTGEQIYSENISIEPEFVTPTILYIILGASFGVGIIAVVLVILSKRKYNGYY